MTQLPPIAYMTPAGDFAASCEVGTPPQHPNLIPAPDGGGYGMHWDGSSWLEDPLSDGRARAFMFGDPVPEFVSRVQAKKALGRDAWTAISSAVEVSNDWNLQCEFDEPVWRRDNPYIIALANNMFGWGNTELDQLFIQAAKI